MTTKVPAVLVELNGNAALSNFIAESSANPSFPTVTQTLGTAGAITTPNTTMVQGYSQLTRSAKICVRIQFVPADTSTVRLVLGGMAGWTVVGFSAGVVDTATGVPVAAAITRENYIYFKPATTNAHWVDYFMELAK